MMSKPKKSWLHESVRLSSVHPLKRSDVTLTLVVEINLAEKSKSNETDKRRSEENQ